MIQVIGILCIAIAVCWAMGFYEMSEFTTDTGSYNSATYFVWFIALAGLVGFTLIGLRLMGVI
jgi:hypothetical protein